MRRRVRAVVVPASRETRLPRPGTSDAWVAMAVAVAPSVIAIRPFCFPRSREPVRYAPVVVLSGGSSPFTIVRLCIRSFSAYFGSQFKFFLVHGRPRNNNITTKQLQQLNNIIIILCSIYRDERTIIYYYIMIKSLYDLKMYNNLNKLNALLQWRQCVKSAVFLDWLCGMTIKLFIYIIVQYL